MTIFIRIDGDLGLDPDEVWPDGDAPEVVTADSVKAAMEAAGSKGIVMPDWGLDFEVYVSVDNGEEVQVWAR